MTKESNIFFVDVTGSAEELGQVGRPFDGLVSGTFTDMLGTDVKITPRDLSQIVKNTKKAIEATRSESGEIVGLPIDSQNHDRGDAAGWIVDVELEDDRIRITPSWTEIGVDLLTRGVQRFFSATLNLRNKVLLGGTLTNWPATRDPKGTILLRPIELSAENSSTWAPVGDTITVNDYPGTDTSNSAIWVTEFQVENTELEQNTEDADDEGGEDAPVGDEQNNEGDLTMDITKEELQAMISEMVNEGLTSGLADLVTPPAENGEGDQKPVNILEVLDLGDAPDQVVQAVQEQMLKQYDEMKRRAAEQTTLMIARIKHEDEVSDFVTNVTAGTDSIPRGLPADPEALKKFALSLNPEQYKYFASLVDTTLDRGFTEFEEKGHNRKIKGETPLPDVYVKALRNKDIELKDLSDPMVAPDLGDLDQYDLTEWQE